MSRFAFGVLALFLVTSCHGRKEPPTLPLQPVTPLTLVAPAQPGDPSVAAYLKVRDPRHVAAEAGAENLLDALGTAGLSALRPGAPITAVLWTPDGLSLDKIPLAGFLPVDLGNQTAKLPPKVEEKMAAEDKQGGVRRLPGFTLFAVTPPARAHLDAGSGLVPLAGDPGPWDVQLLIDFAPILKTYGMQLHIGVAAMQGMLAAQPKKPGAPDPAMLGGLLTKLVGKIEETKSLALGLDFLPDEVEFTTVVDDLKGGAGGPVAAPDLVSFLPAEDIRVQWNARDLAGKINGYLDWFGPILDSSSPGLASPLRSMMEDMSKLGDLQTGIAMSFKSETGLRGAGLIKTGDPAAYLAMVQRSVALMNQPAVKDSYKKMGLDLTTTIQPAVRKLHGWPVDAYHVAMRPRADQTKEQRAVFKKAPFLLKFMTSNYEMMQMGPYVLISFNRPLEELADALLSGHGGRPLQAAHKFPAGGTLYGDIDMAGLSRSIGAMLPPDAQGKLPDLTGVASTVTVASYDGGARTVYRSRVPRPLIRALSKKAK